MKKATKPVKFEVTATALQRREKSQARQMDQCVKNEIYTNSTVRPYLKLLPNNKTQVLCLRLANNSNPEENILKSESIE